MSRWELPSTSRTATAAHQRPWPAGAEGLRLAGAARAAAGLGGNLVCGDLRWVRSQELREQAGWQRGGLETDRIFVETLGRLCLNPHHRSGRRTAALGAGSPEVGEAGPL